MRIFSTKLHGFLDYLVGVLLMVSPWMFGFADGGAAQWVPVLLGAALIVYSLMTDYELGLVKVIPMKVHLGIDVASGVVLVLSPFIFGFAAAVFLPHLIFGLIEIGAGLTTRTETDQARVARHR